MKLSSAYLKEQLEKEYPVTLSGGLSGNDGYLRPFLYNRKRGFLQKTPFSEHRVCVADAGKTTLISPKNCFGKNKIQKNAFWIVCAPSAAGNGLEITKEMEPIFQGTCFALLSLADGEDAGDVLNFLQQVYDRCEEWDRNVHELMVKNAGMEKILETTAVFLGNPMMVMGLDFSLTAQSKMEELPKRAQLFTADGVNMEYMNALLQDEGYRKLEQAKGTVFFPAYISGCSSLNRNLCAERKEEPADIHLLFTHRLVLTSCKREVSKGDICILEALTERLEFLLSHAPAVPAADDMEQIFMRILTDKTADYMKISRQLSVRGWGASQKYLCLVLQITYVNQQQLSTKAICRYLKKQFPDSVSFLYKEEIVTYFNVSRLEMSEDDVAAKLVYFIRDSYLKAGYSRAVQGHMFLRRQYVQAEVALDVGSRRRPYLWIHHFDQVVLPYIMEQAVRRLPGNMLCHEGLLRLQEMDARNHTEYVKTLKVYLEQHLGATQAAKELFIHRSTFLYRLDKIKEILQSDLEDPDEIFYLELSLRLMEIGR